MTAVAGLVPSVRLRLASTGANWIVTSPDVEPADPPQASALLRSATATSDGDGAP